MTCVNTRIVFNCQAWAALLLFTVIVLFLLTVLALHQLFSIERVDFVTLLRLQCVVIAEVVSTCNVCIILHKAPAGLVDFQKFLTAEFVLELLQLFHLFIVLKHLLSLRVY